MISVTIIVISNSISSSSSSSSSDNHNSINSISNNSYNDSNDNRTDNKNSSTSNNDNCLLYNFTDYHLKKNKLDIKENNILPEGRTSMVVFEIQGLFEMVFHRTLSCYRWKPIAFERKTLSFRRDRSQSWKEYDIM